MKHVKTMVALLGMTLGHCAWAGPYDQAYAIIESGNRSSAHKQETVAITKIDGQSTRNARRPDPVAPGKHAVEVSFSSARTIVEDQVKTVAIDVQPCKRYRVVAQYDNALAGKWEPQVQSVEDIGECRKKFLKSAGAKS